MLRISIVILLLLSLLISGCSELEEVEFAVGIERKPDVQNLARRLQQPLQKLPEYNPNFRSRPDLRSHDLTAVDLADKLETLLNSSFNTVTKWPATMPDSFNPAYILDLNKNPGLQLRSLHQKGITGEGVSVAIIDYTLLVDHIEYKNNLKMYREVNYENAPAEFHGSSMASILAGHSLGVAPGVNLYYVAVRNMDIDSDKIIQNQNFTAQAIRGIIKLNETLSEADKIRVISLSQWWSPHTKGYKNMLKAMQEAKEKGIFVISCNLWQFNNSFHLYGLVKNALADPDSVDSYYPAPWEHWLAAINRNGHGDFYQQEFSAIESKKILMVPSAGIASAGAEHTEDYIFVPEVNWSNTIPYLAGLYALSCQVKPDITPELFWHTAYQTGTLKVIEIDERKYEARIVNPVELINSLGDQERSDCTEEVVISI
ncbi:MAG: S8 family peptidase [Firmicutes bacterium]|nr:S8 family peptidase [Bacillota bacterium]